MPLSGVSCDSVRHAVVPWVLENLQPRRILDLGCGAGMYGHEFKTRDSKIWICGVDIYRGYAMRQDCQATLLKYDALIYADVRCVARGLISVPHDIVMIMDVIEHMEKHEAVHMLAAFRRCVISTPLFDYKQGALHGNQYETHRCWFTADELTALGYTEIARATTLDTMGTRGEVGAFVRVC